MVVGINAKGGDEDATREFLVGFSSVEKKEYEIIWGECGITCAQMTPSELVEYQFEDDVWTVSKSGKEALEMFLG